MLLSMGSQRGGHDLVTEQQQPINSVVIVQVDSKEFQPYIYMYPFSPILPFHPSCHLTLSRVPCAIQ